MNTIASFLAKFLCHLAAIFFFILTTQTSIASVSHDYALATFQEYVNYKRADEVATSSLEGRVWSSLRMPAKK